MNLQPQPRGNAISQHPFRQFPRIEQAMRGIASSTRIFAKGRGENSRVHPSAQLMTSHEVASEFVVRAITQHKLDFILRIERFEVFHVEGVGLARIWTLYVHDLNHTLGHPLQWPLAAGL